MIKLPENWSDWEVIGRIGDGSYSVVYEAARKDDPTIRCAIKLVTVPQDESEYLDMVAEGFDEQLSRSFFDEAVRDFTREVRLMEHFKGMQNIVSIEDYKVLPKENGIGSYIFIRMELLNSLEKYLSDKFLTEEEVLQIGIDICTALEFCQEKNIIHRDIKPANIFVNDRVGSHVFYKLGDFGIARNLEGKTQGMSAKGTPNYMAPEVAAGLPYDSTADIYSLGLTLYWLLNGKRLPFFPQTQLYSPSAKREALARRLTGEALPSPVNASPRAAEAVLKACAYKKEDRYQTATEMKRALRAAQSEEEIARDQTEKHPEETNPAPTAEKRKKRRAAVIGMAAAVLLLAGGGKIVWDQTKPDVPDLTDVQDIIAEDTDIPDTGETEDGMTTDAPSSAGNASQEDNLSFRNNLAGSRKENPAETEEESEETVWPDSETEEGGQPASETAETATPSPKVETATPSPSPAEETEEPLPDWLWSEDDEGAAAGEESETEETEEPVPDWLRDD